MSVSNEGRRFVVVSVVAWLVALASCMAGNPYAVGSFERAQFFADHGDHEEAADAYGAFVRQNPADSLAAVAQYRKGMQYMATKEYPLAAVELQILQKDYPTSPLLEDAAYEEAIAYYEEVGRLERDLSGAYEARDHFQKFLAAYPQSAHVADVNAKLAAISDMLVRKRLRAVEVYRQLGHWQAAAITLDHILDEEPGSSLIDQVLWQRARAAEKLGDDATARTMFQKLVDSYPQSPLASRARHELAAVPVPAPTAAVGAHVGS